MNRLQVWYLLNYEKVLLGTCCLFSFVSMGQVSQWEPQPAMWVDVGHATVLRQEAQQVQAAYWGSQDRTGGLMSRCISMSCLAHLLYVRLVGGSSEGRMWLICWLSCGCFARQYKVITREASGPLSVSAVQPGPLSSCRFQGTGSHSRNFGWVLAANDSLSSV